LGAAISINGVNARIHGVRMAGNITLENGLTGSFIGNPQTSGTFTNNTAQGQCQVLHKPLSSFFDVLDVHRLMTATTSPALIRTARIVRPGDNNVSFFAYNGVNQITYSSPISTDRTVTLDTTGAVDGCGGRVTRLASATGGFDVIVGALGSLAPGEWLDFQWDGSSAYELTARGSLS
jgi:hypothetical protein